MKFNLKLDTGETIEFDQLVKNPNLDNTYFWIDELTNCIAEVFIDNKIYAALDEQKEHQIGTAEEING